MSDLFHPDVPTDFIREIFRVVADTGRHRYQVLTKRSRRLRTLSGELTWPENLWVGVTVESSEYAFRVEHLSAVPAAVRFVSLEPLLGPVPSLNLRHVDWVIAGGESGPNARDVDAAWVREVRDRCVVAKVPFFFKQWGGRTPKARGRALDGTTWDQMPTGRTRRAVNQ